MVIISQKKYEALESDILIYINSSVAPKTSADVTRHCGISFPFAKKILFKLADKKKIEKTKFADRTFFSKRYV